MRRLPVAMRALLLSLALTVTASAQFIYQLNTNPPTTVTPGTTLTMPTTVVGDSSALTLRVINNTSTAAVLSAVSVGGATSGFSLSQVPNLPLTLMPGIPTFITVSFAPPRAGTLTGGISINSDTFLLTGVGAGTQLAFSYQAGGSTTPLVGTNPSVIFPAVPVSGTSRVTFFVNNVGSLPVVVTNIGVGQLNSPFALSGLPSLPTTLAAGASFNFTIVATPSALGFSNGTLNIDGTAIGLVVSGTAPPALSSYTITGASGVVTPKSQPKLSLTLGTPYPVGLAGTLTLNVSGNLPADPAVQFSTGGRSVQFTIPVNSTSAVFGNTGSASVGTSVAFQTGTVGSTITVVPIFATQAGSVDVTPPSPTTLQLTVAPAAPSLVGIQLSNLTVNGFSISATGYATTRTLTAFNVEFAMASGFKMPQTQFKIDLQQTANIWFQGTASQAFGGQFVVTVPFTFQGSLPEGETIQNAIASVSVSVANEVGSSNTAQARLQ